jgi:ABC-type lipoprotein export system ATPase subunit
MSEMYANSVCFVNIHIRNYGIFRDLNEIKFNRHQTFIFGESGAGKTTIANALSCLGPVPDVKPHYSKVSSDMLVDVVTNGNRDLIKKYRNVILLRNDERIINDQETIFKEVVKKQYREEIKDAAKSIFQTLISAKLRQIDIHDLNPTIMTAGEKICLEYALVFAFRKVLNLDLPIVLDSPYGLLDTELRKGVRAFLKEQSCQQIMLGTEHELSKEYKPDYMIRYAEGYSQIIKQTS